MAAYIQCFWGLFLSLSLYFIHSTPTPHVYIVYLGLNHIHDPTLTSKYHHKLLSNVFASEEDAKQSMLYSYKHSFSGFSAKLNSTQATALAKMEGVISVFRSKTLQLHTTRSWDFVGLTLDNNEVTPLQLAFGDGIVVGMFDSGIWPESESFSEEPRMNPIPSTWRGECVKGERFDPKTNCNRKLIGARYYLKGFEEENGPLSMSGIPEYQSPRDFLGHGTHTASTAVGSIVKNASFFGLGLGTARGGAPRARLAVYKICWANIVFNSVCSEIDILAAFDDALHDGVHIISASFGPRPPILPLFETSAGIGSFHAMQLGITVAFSAGNEGPDPSLVTNVAPWSISVAASSVDRMFRTQILVDNSLSIMGESFLPTEIKGKLADPIMYFEHGVCNSDYYMNESKPAVGKVVVCFSTDGPIDDAVAAVKTANASGLIFVEPMTRQTADVEIVPTVYVNFVQGTQIKNYLFESPSLPKVRIIPTKTIIGKSPAPTVADFSSRGPSSLTPDILKPDVTAPGVSILAAWPYDTSPTLSPSDKRRVSWNFQSGTSMSCPHVSGVAALIKSAHPRWSTSAIRSALITTGKNKMIPTIDQTLFAVPSMPRTLAEYVGVRAAMDHIYVDLERRFCPTYTRDTTCDSILAGGSMKVADPFDIGAGHINPLKALDPGLVYEMKTSDYILFLCNIGYTQENIYKMVLPCPGVDTSCPKVPKSNTNINYPSITVSNLKSTMTIKRTVRNVGHKKNIIYFASIVKPDGVEVFIWPRALIFSWFNEENSYYVTLKPLKKSQGRYDFGEIVWSDGFHKVRSPLVVCVNTTDDSSDSIARTSSSI